MTTTIVIFIGAISFLFLGILVRQGQKKQTEELLAKVSFLKDRLDIEELRKEIHGKPRKDAEKVIERTIEKFRLIDTLDDYSKYFTNISEIKIQISSFSIGKVKGVIADMKNHVRLIDKYGEEIADKLVHHRYFLGMTEEQLIDCKGKPTKIEKEVLKTKTKIIYVYGNKSSGDVFVFVNGILERFKDR